MEGIIIKALSGFYYVYSDGQTYACKARGKFRKMNIKPLVGDHVDFQIENKDEGYILSIHDRTNSMIRPPISNIDQALIIVSAREPDFQRSLLNKFLLMVENMKIHPVIIITKMDLVSEEDPVHKMIQEYLHDGYKVYPISSKDQIGLEAVRKLFKDKSSVLIGQSGVGKSSFLNALNASFEIETGEISQVLGRGKHTTRHVEFYPIFEGLIADTPGFSSLILEMDRWQAALAYHDYAKLSEECKFRGCLHMNEPDCAVKKAVEEGRTSKSRYKDYLAMMNEIMNRKEKY